MSSNIVEKQVEAAIVTALESALSSVTGAPDVIGWWQPSLPGTVKSQASTCILVTVGVRANAGFGSKIITLRGSITVKTAASTDPTGDKVSAFTVPAVNLLAGWNASPETLNDAVGISGAFRADGLIFTEGGDPDFDEQLACWFVAVPFQIKGCLL